MIRRALDATGWRDGIEVTSGLPDWFTLRVSSHLLTAERLVRFMAEYQAALPDDERDLLMSAFREMLLNAMEHGAGFDSEQVIEVTAAKTARAIVYHFRDAGSGFDRTGLPHAARSLDPADVLATAAPGRDGPAAGRTRRASSRGRSPTSSSSTSEATRCC